MSNPKSYQMKKLLVLITLGIMALGHLQSQSIWREHPESVKVFKRLHNQWITDYYASEVEMIKEVFMWWIIER